MVAESGPRLTAIYVATSAAGPMQAVRTVEAIARRGLRGDRYAAAAGTWQGGDACQVTLITEHDLQSNRALTETLAHGGHRRNLVVAGVTARELEGKKFRIGAAVFQYHKPCPPCGHLDRVSGQPLAGALGRQGGGVCLRVVTGGKLTVGDVLEILVPAPSA